MENEANTVTIPLDEYFDLRTKAEANIFLTNELGSLQGRFNELERRLWELEQKAERI